MSKTYIPAPLRRQVVARANSCCEYCLQPEILAFASHQIDHVISEKHGGKTIAENLAMACLPCNTFKGSDIASIDPETGKITGFFNPRLARWDEHFRIENGMIMPLTPQARATVNILQLNRRDRLNERRLWLNEFP
jgi:hypothetical protein